MGKQRQKTYRVQEPGLETVYESQIVEWKESWRDDYLKWICGFANAQGGTLVIGKNDQGKVTGVKEIKKLLVDIPNKVRDILGIVVVPIIHF
jgi:ATP-dependent DNA helicase RecG